jgi:cytochrome oxidase assembly protein ShyY1
VSRFRPSWIATVGTTAVLAGLLSLGFWQLRRHEAAVARKATYDRTMALPPIEVKSRKALRPLTRWRRVRVLGQFAGPQVRVGPSYDRYQGAMHDGVRLVAPLKLGDGSLLFVDRGWVPDGMDDSIATLVPQGEQALEGLLLRSRAEVGSHLKGDLFRSVDTGRIAEHLGVRAASGFLRLGAGKDGLPRAGYAAYRIRRPHMQYAVTWFGLALALLVTWVGTGFVRGRRLREEE